MKEIPAKIVKSLEIELVDHMDQVLLMALALKEGEELFKEGGDDSLHLDVPLVENRGENTGVTQHH